MGLCITNENVNITQADWVTMGFEGLEDLLQKTQDLYVIESKNLRYGYVGLMLPNLISDKCFLWLVLDSLLVDRHKEVLREAKKVTKKFIKALPYEVWAEASIYSWRDNKFLQYVGFQLQHQAEDRFVYKWM